ncbi:carboxymuconolactone decarboxylase family protein [Microbacterium sp.]|uniref:carboxymuconolactone decarboxylase family protein n=1 Tax=Microbacterium sp. TaxID=51671 RepID=UPI00273567E9|nr:carboxymuconolactone decarboxylase family protein [Microbacterium sp.]MDP3951959.1 carboxymuconolactone decarboxylase family protein [Microbacterium sp.]
MKNVYKLAADGYRGFNAVEEYVNSSGIPRGLLELVRIRTSQINGCAVCTDMHSHKARSVGESDERLWSVAAWRDTPFFSDAERAALALTEAMTRIADNSAGVPDGIWDEVAAHFADEELAALVTAIASVNAWNRINVAARLAAGSFR